VRIVVNASALAHGIAADEIRAVITYSLLRYRISSRIYPDAINTMFIGRIDNEPYIEVAAENISNDEWEVFHAMLLTKAIAQEVYDLSHGEYDLRGEVTDFQRPYIGPQYGRTEQLCLSVRHATTKP